ncbi:MAG: saccharopine dehydrogenase NADP-binding domain-containing protein, partial [Thermoplasmata archaeon]|nr:saccharopine dehydrogenase NADP-binding domain-containing protein [Thermoplasmata archaeon]
MKTVVLGVGAVGSVAADLLANSEEFDSVVLADIDLEKAQKMEERVANDKVSSMKLDATNVEQMAQAFKGVDLVLNCVIPRFNFAIMDACLMAKANYADMASDIFLSKEKPGEIVKEPPLQYQIRKYSDAYEKAGIIGMLGMGCDPGMANVFARMGADRLDQVKDILVRDGDNGHVEG